MQISRYIRIVNGFVSLNGVSLDTSSRGGDLLKELYRASGAEYPKFFKMDVLCRLGFVCSELLLKDTPGRFEPRQDRAVLVFSRSGSLCDDGNFARSLADYPSPALFVYTLPNIVTGEIAIRNAYRGDTTAFVLSAFSPTAIADNVKACFCDGQTRSALVGWLECRSEDDFEAVMVLLESGENGDIDSRALASALEKIYASSENDIASN